jgi:hypothetical protein
MDSTATQTIAATTKTTQIQIMAITSIRVEAITQAVFSTMQILFQTQIAIHLAKVAFSTAVLPQTTPAAGFSTIETIILASALAILDNLTQE